MTTPTIELMLSIVDIANQELRNSTSINVLKGVDGASSLIVEVPKIAVHCHAGFGRTGIVIACVLIAQSCQVNNDVLTIM